MGWPRISVVAVAMTHRQLVLAVVAVAMTASAACGDSFREVVLYNGTDVALEVFHNGGRDVPASRVEIAPGASHTAGWLWPITSDDFRSRKVEALDDQGQLVFCRTFSYRDLQQLGWKVDIGRERAC